MYDLSTFSRHAQLRHAPGHHGTPTGDHRHARLRGDMQALLRDFEAAPEQIGQYLSQAEATGALTGQEVHVAIEHLLAMAGPAFTARALGTDHAGLAQRHAARAERMMTELRATRTEVLATELAADLGLSASEVDVRTDADDARRTDAIGAHGLMDQGVVYLCRRHYDPQTPSGRELLAHEMVHLAQRRLPGGDGPPSVGHAEAEPGRMAQAFGAGYRLGRPTQALAPHARAADTGAAEGVASRAQEGLAGSGRSLPFLPRIQAAFGRHKGQ